MLRCFLVYMAGYALHSWTCNVIFIILKRRPYSKEVKLKFSCGRWWHSSLKASSLISFAAVHPGGILKAVQFNNMGIAYEFLFWSNNVKGRTKCGLLEVLQPVEWYGQNVGLLFFFVQPW